MRERAKARKARKGQGGKAKKEVGRKRERVKAGKKVSSKE
jgi:hypothetical protein